MSNSFTMEASSFLHLHQEHRTWMSQLDFWKGELTFLQGLLEKLPPGQRTVNSLDHKFNHLNRWLDNMRHQIDSHENFMKEVWKEFPESLELTNMEDHQHNRDHMKNFRIVLDGMKEQLYAQLHKSGLRA